MVGDRHASTPRYGQATPLGRCTFMVRESSGGDPMASSLIRQLVPPLGEPGCWNGRNGESGLGVVRCVVEEREARAAGLAEIHDVEGGRVLIEVVAITARIEAEQRAE